MLLREQLAERFSVPGVSFAEHQQLVCVNMDTPLVKGQIYLHGAHVTEWQPAGHSGVLWMSQRSHFQLDKPIRGGVPICFPWFGPHANDPALPAHGLARLRNWELVEVDRRTDHGVRLRLTTSIDPFELVYDVEFGERLKLALTTRLPAGYPQALQFEDALHTYFAVSHIQQVRIAGLETVPYIDKVGQLAMRSATGSPIEFHAETDRVYQDTFHTCRLFDCGRKRELIISKNGSSSTVVWNPWIDKSIRMPDFGDAEWPEMVCIETANVGARAVKLHAGQQHTTAVVIEVVHC